MKETRIAESQPIGSLRRARTAWLRVWLGLALLALALPAAAQLNPRTVSKPGPSDIIKTQQQLERVDELGRRHLGQRIRARSKDELGLLQRLLDERFVRESDVLGQQALGVALGNILATELRLTWVVVDDEYGHSRALRYRKADDLFFPVTMISKRIGTGQRVDVRALYAKVEDRVKTLEGRTN
jgi:hypothetical protein